MQYDLHRLRIMGVLQRVACCFAVAAAAELLLARPPSSAKLPCSGDRLARWPAVRLLAHDGPIWAAALALCALHTALLYGVEVPGCGRGLLTPECNAASYIDSHVLTPEHMYFPSNGGDFGGRDVTYQRLPQCSSCSPGALL